MFVENFTKFINYYGKGRKLKLFGFFILSLINGAFEFIGIALIYPFILLIVKPKMIINSDYYINFANFLKIHDTITIALILGAIVVLIFITKNLFMIFSLYLQNMFITNWKFAINKQLMYYYLFSPYKKSLETSNSEKIYNLNFLVNQTFDGFVVRIISLITNFVIISMILLLLLINFPFAALVTCLFVFSSMTVHNKIFKQKVKHLSQKLFKASVSNNEKTIENINNLKEIKILSSQNYFYNQYLNVQKEFNKMLFINQLNESASPYIIEIMIVLSLFLLAGIISCQNINNTPWMIASYAVVTASIFRMAPLLNRIQSSLNNINNSHGFIKTILNEYEKSDFDFIEHESDIQLEFKESLKLDNISFAYNKTPVIKNLNLEIKKGEFVGIIGLSGAGKSTLTDIIMGLLPLDSGRIFIDGQEFNNANFSALRKLIGYVPQQINVLDGSFKRNVAWGIEEDKIIEEKVFDALKKAQIYDFVLEQGGINSSIIISSNGLSQGQKQRLAIARALYRDSKILIFDEATSALDVETEYEITQMLNKLKGEKTIIAIAHRLSTLKSCDRLIYIKNGEVIDTGNFEGLSQKYPDFEKLIKLSNLNIKD